MMRSDRGAKGGSPGDVLSNGALVLLTACRFYRREATIIRGYATAML